ncbi:Hypothetical predicted protein, partial [Mytilus galloprovincialis]
MAAFMAVLLEQEVSTERRPRIFRDRYPIYYMAEIELKERYRMPRIKILEVLDLIRKDKSPISRSHAIPEILQVLVSLRYYAKEYINNEVGDLHGISKARVSRCITSVSKPIVSEMDNTKFRQQKMNVVKRGLHRIAKVPNVIGAVDSTLIPIIAPKENEVAHVCRKGNHSLNIQAVVDHEM